ncbi:MAG: hypothetical protein R3F60_15000 [bacterium]
MRALIDRVGLWPLLTALLVVVIVLVVVLRRGEPAPSLPEEAPASTGPSRAERMAQAVLCVQGATPRPRSAAPWPTGSRPGPLRRGPGRLQGGLRR